MRDREDTETVDMQREREKEGERGRRESKYNGREGGERASTISSVEHEKSRINIFKRTFFPFSVLELGGGGKWCARHEKCTF